METLGIKGLQFKISNMLRSIGDKIIHSVHLTNEEKSIKIIGHMDLTLEFEGLCKELKGVVTDEEKEKIKKSLDKLLDKVMDFYEGIK